MIESGNDLAQREVFTQLALEWSKSSSPEVQDVSDRILAYLTQ